MRRALWLGSAVLAAIGCLHAFQRPWRLFESLEPYDDVPIPVGGDHPADWTFARLMYPSTPYARFEFRRRDWRERQDGGGNRAGKRVSHLTDLREPRQTSVANSLLHRSDTCWQLRRRDARRRSRVHFEPLRNCRVGDLFPSWQANSIS